MRHLIIIIILILFPTYTFATTTNTANTEQKAQIISVIDGDTVIVKYNKRIERVRLIGIDTPETKDPRKTVQCFGQEASKRMKSLIGGKTIVLKSSIGEKNRDKYGRLLRYIYLDKIFINAKMVQDGYAYMYPYFDFAYKNQFKIYENEAKTKKLGLWAPTTCNGLR